MRKKKTGDITIVGVVIPASWDEDGGMTGISIQATDEVEYVVEQDHLGHGLMTLVHKRVKAGGSIRQRLDGKIVIRIKEYEMITQY